MLHYLRFRIIKPLQKHLFVRKIFIEFCVDSHDILLLFLTLLFLILCFLLFKILLIGVFYVIFAVFMFFSVVYSWIYLLIDLAVFAAIKYDGQSVNLRHLFLRHNLMDHSSCLINMALITQSLVWFTVHSSLLLDDTSKYRLDLCGDIDNKKYCMEFYTLANRCVNLLTCLSTSNVPETSNSSLTTLLSIRLYLLVIITNSGSHRILNTVLKSSFVEKMSLARPLRTSYQDLLLVVFWT